MGYPVMGAVAAELEVLIWECDLVVPFDWTDIHDLEQLFENPEHLAGCGPVNAVKFLTAAIRGERFATGTLSKASPPELWPSYWISSSHR